MIDVVFLLIVFFTLVINFAAADQNERIKLPISELAQPPERPAAEAVTLHILAEGNIIYNGIEYPIQGLREQIDHRIRVLRFLHIPPGDVTVILRADALSRSGAVLDVIELCQTFGLTKFVLRTKPKED